MRQELESPKNPEVTISGKMRAGLGAEAGSQGRGCGPSEKNPHGASQDSDLAAAPAYVAES